MREIKFRARHLQTGQWFYGSSNLKGEDLTTFDDDILSLSLFWLQIEKGVLDKDTVGEWTGLKDKNGKEIYEGDITCRHWDNGTWQNGIIIYEEASFLWQEIGGNERHRIAMLHPIGINTKHSEIVGNIYENPELLEGKDG